MINGTSSNWTIQPVGSRIQQWVFQKNETRLRQYGCYWLLLKNNGRRTVFTLWFQSEGPSKFNFSTNTYKNNEKQLIMIIIGSISIHMDLCMYILYIWKNYTGIVDNTLHSTPNFATASWTALWGNIVYCSAHLATSFSLPSFMTWFPLLTPLSPPATPTTASRLRSRRQWKACGACPTNVERWEKFCNSQDLPDGQRWALPQVKAKEEGNHWH